MRCNVYPVVLITWIMILNISDAMYELGQIRLRIPESELNKVTSVLVQRPGAHDEGTEDGKVEGVHENFSFAFDDLVEKSSNEEIRIHIPEDDILAVTTFYSSIQINGTIKLTSLDDNRVIHDGDFDVTLENVTLVSSSVASTSNLIVSVDNHHVLHINFSNCSADVRTVSAARDVFSALVTEADLREIFQIVVCRTHRMRFTLRFEDSGITFNLFNHSVTIGTEVYGVDLQNNAVIVTRKIETTNNKEGGLMPYNNGGIIPPFPPPDAADELFTINIHMDTFNALFREFLIKLGVGMRKLTVGDLIPSLNQLSELDTDGVYMNLLFHTVRRTYPDAVGRMIVQDAVIYFTIKNGALQLHFDINADMAVTLNCDQNRTYSAFNFTLNLVFPAQVGYDNKYLTFKVLGLGGSLTVINSTVGHVVDRQTKGVLLSLPYYIDDELDALSESLEGIPLADYLPMGVFAEVESISLGSDSVIIGGTLLPTDPRLPLLGMSEISWTGNTVSDLYLNGFDRTSEDLEPREEQNCKKPPPTISSATNTTFQFVLLLFVTAIRHTC